MSGEAVTQGAGKKGGARSGRASMLVVAVPAAAFLIALVIVSIGAEWIAPYDPLQQSLRHALQGPSAEHWLGTDDLGRDVLSRLIFGGRIALIAAIEATSRRDSR